MGRTDFIFNPLQICVMTNHLLEHSVLKINTLVCLVNSVGAVSSVHPVKGGEERRIVSRTNTRGHVTGS